MIQARSFAVACALAAIALVAALPATGRLLSGVSFFPSADSVFFRPKESSQKNLVASAAITVKAASSVPEWSMSYQALPLVGQVDTLPAAQILIKTPLTDGFVPADRPRPVAKGGIIQLPGNEVASISLMLTLSGRELSDEYSGIMVSPEGAPPIKLRLFTKPMRNDPPPAPTPAAPLEINPAMIEMDLGAGETKETELFILNNQNDQITVRARVVPMQIDDSGAVSYEGPASDPYSAAGWITLEPSPLKILSWSTGKIKATLSSPKTFAGSAHAAILLEQVSPAPKAGGPAPVSRIFVTRPGGATVHRSRIALFEQTAGSDSGHFRVLMQNTGNAYLTVKEATISVLQQEASLARFQLSPGKALALPGGLREFTSAWAGMKLLPPGSYTFETAIRFVKGPAATSSLTIELPQPETAPPPATDAAPAITPPKPDKP